MQPHDICLAIWERGKFRRAYLEQRKMIDNRIKGIVRSSFADPTSAQAKDTANQVHAELLAGTCTHPVWSVSFGGFVQAHAGICAGLSDIESQMRAYARMLPIWQWAKDSPGLAELSLATLISEIVDPGDYSNPAKVWKRMGVAVINGERQRKVTGDEALVHGYNPTRRSALWNIGENIARQKNRRPDHPWIMCYTADKERQLERGLPKGHAERRARRKMTKMMLRDLWREWEQTVGLNP